jgi:hypothetical protein
MKVKEFIARVKSGERVSFEETMALIREQYDYSPTRFSNGVGNSKVVNEAGTNEGSCRIFAFARLNRLAPEHTLALFGDYYREQVLNHPDGTDHANIRTFMKHGWAGIAFDGEPLKRREPSAVG